MEAELTAADQVHVACDTGLFWCILHHDAPWLADFEAMARNGVVFSFADHALAEILNQLETGRFSEAEYVRVISECARFISPDVPILPGKRQLAKWCDKNADAARLEKDRRERAAIWKLMLTSKSLADFGNGIVYELADGTKQGIALKSGDASKALEEERVKWRTRFAAPVTGWASRPLADRLADITGTLNDEIDCEPALDIRLDAALRHEEETVRQRSDANNPLNPNSEKRRNDGIDYNMAYVFMKRILLCTQEKKYPGALRNLGSYQADWVFRPEELVEAWKTGKLKRPEWPK